MLFEYYNKWQKNNFTKTCKAEFFTHSSIQFFYAFFNIWWHIFSQYTILSTSLLLFTSVSLSLLFTCVCISISISVSSSVVLSLIYNIKTSMYYFQNCHWKQKKWTNIKLTCSIIETLHSTAQCPVRNHPFPNCSTFQFSRLHHHLLDEFVLHPLKNIKKNIYFLYRYKQNQKKSQIIYLILAVW